MFTVLQVQSGQSSVASTQCCVVMCQMSCSPACDKRYSVLMAHVSVNAASPNLPLVTEPLGPSAPIMEPFRSASVTLQFPLKQHPGMSSPSSKPSAPLPPSLPALPWHCSHRNNHRQATLTRKRTHDRMKGPRMTCSPRQWHSPHELHSHDQAPPTRTTCPHPSRELQNNTYIT